MKGGVGMKRWVTAALMLALLSAGMVRAETTGREDQKQDSFRGP